MKKSAGAQKRKNYKKGDLVRIVETNIGNYKSIYFNRLIGTLGIVIEKQKDHSWNKDLHPVYKVFLSNFFEYCSFIDIEKLL